MGFDDDILEDIAGDNELELIAFAKSLKQDTVMLSSVTITLRDIVDEPSIESEETI